MKKLLLWLLKLSITSGILNYIFTIILLSVVIASIISAKLSYIIIALLIVAFTIYIEAYQMKLLTDKQGTSLSTRQIIEINLTTRFYGLFLPGLAGGAIRWYKLSRPDNKSAEALALSFLLFARNLLGVGVGGLFDAKKLFLSDQGKSAIMEETSI